jgi:hypothetical protein
MLRAEAVESVRLDEPAGGLVVGTCSPSVIYRKLPDWALEAESQIHELHCSDDSLPALFHSLLQIHRGKA